LANALARNATLRNLRSRNTSASIIILPLLLPLPLSTPVCNRRTPSIGAT
jgi:hypothetical protein